MRQMQNINKKILQKWQRKRIIQKKIPTQIQIKNVYIFNLI